MGLEESLRFDSCRGSAFAVVVIPPRLTDRGDGLLRRCGDHGYVVIPVEGCRLSLGGDREVLCVLRSIHGGEDTVEQPSPAAERNEFSALGFEQRERIARSKVARFLSDVLRRVVQPDEGFSFR